MTDLFGMMGRMRNGQFGPAPPADAGNSIKEQYDLISMDQLRRLMYRFEDSKFLAMFKRPRF